MVNIENVIYCWSGMKFMIYAEFKALVINNEINLNKIARHFGINRNYKWEESLCLHEQLLQGIVQENNNKIVYIFHFGSMVFINFQHHEIMDLLNYLKKIQIELNIADKFRHYDDYKLEIRQGEEPLISNDLMLTDQAQDYQMEIIATILAKSVALEKVEVEIGDLLDEIEYIVAKLQQGELAFSDDKLAKIAGNILGFKLNTISYIMLLDKPDITWDNEDASNLFNDLSDLFELDDRYKTVLDKTATLMDITEVFSGLAHAKRGNKLEWAVIILIAIEIVLSLYEMFVRN